MDAMIDLRRGKRCDVCHTLTNFDRIDFLVTVWGNSESVLTAMPAWNAMPLGNFIEDKWFRQFRGQVGTIYNLSLQRMRLAPLSSRASLQQYRDIPIAILRAAY